MLAVWPVLEAKRDGIIYPLPENVSRLWHEIGFIRRAVIAFGLWLALPVIFLPLYCFYFWITFDALYNLFTDRPLFYVGSTAETDKFFHNSEFLLKIIGFFSSIILIIISKL